MAREHRDIADAVIARDVARACEAIASQHVDNNPDRHQQLWLRAQWSAGFLTGLAAPAQRRAALTDSAKPFQVADLKR